MSVFGVYVRRGLSDSRLCCDGEAGINFLKQVNFDNDATLLASTLHVSMCLTRLIQSIYPIDVGGQFACSYKVGQVIKIFKGFYRKLKNSFLVASQ